ncbi:hypothetical protein [Thauera sinica]|uniref:Uncharacterized protein n=1 Tax=Thauera sinica TaxID=2665146 RepID=A0ABW1AV73_9RHOO|nr:hypothetical protein [Thauera sp. K11]
MKIFLRGLRFFFVSLVAGILASEILFRMDQFYCDDLHGENAAGGGAALGMIMLAFLASALLSEFAILAGIDLARHFGLIPWRATWKTEVVSLAVVLVISGVAAYQFIQSSC